MQRLKLSISLSIFFSNVGLVILLIGFFLTKKDIDQRSIYEHKLDLFNLTHSQFKQDDVIEYKKNNIPHKFEKAVFFIIDALRLDFLVESNDSDSSGVHNNFKNVHKILRENSSRSLLFGFKADPPTVTSQRLKGLTTGTLPTFVDIGSNFNSSYIKIDNIIDQCLSDGKR
jgi:phosphatidylinositol glycan class O